jgi:enoyl-CoA hydratase
VALGCDFIYAAEGGRFVLSEVKLGIMPGAGRTQTLARAADERRAKELVMTGRAFAADEAYGWGIFNRLCSWDALLAETLDTANAIAETAPLSTRQAKKSIHYGLQMDLENAYRPEIEVYNRRVTTEDRLEGIRAFNEKRKPEFEGR